MCVKFYLADDRGGWRSFESSEGVNVSVGKRRSRGVSLVPRFRVNSDFTKSLDRSELHNAYETLSRNVVNSR